MYRAQYWKPTDLILCRSDKGDGGWSLHAPWATDEQIAMGEEPPLLCGEAEAIDQEWNRPNELDRQMAFNVLSARDR